MKAVAFVVGLIVAAVLAYYVLDAQANSVINTCGAPHCQPIGTHILSPMNGRVALVVGLLLTFYVAWGLRLPPILHTGSGPVCTPTPCASP